MSESAILGVLKVLKDEKTANLLLPLNTILIFSYFFLFVRFEERFLELDLPTRFILSIVLSTTILYYLTCIEAYILKRRVEGREYYFNFVFLLLLAFVVVIYVISRFTLPALTGKPISNEIMYGIIYGGIIIIPLVGSKIFRPSPD